MAPARIPEPDCFQDHMPGDQCFGCGSDNPDGLQIKSYWDGDACVCVWLPGRIHQSWAGLTCGGIIATLIDCHCTASAMAIAVRNENRRLDSEPHYRFATGSLEIRYLKPAPTSCPLILKACLKNIRKRRIYTLDCKVYSRSELTTEATAIDFLVYSSDQKPTQWLPFSAPP